MSSFILDCLNGKIELQDRSYQDYSEKERILTELDENETYLKQCHLVCAEFVKLRSKSSGLLLKNIFENKFPIKLSNFEKWKFIENLWTSMCFGGII